MGRSIRRRQFLLQVRARNFARSWSVLQMFQSIPLLLGVPLSGLLESQHGPRAGYWVAGGAMVLAAVVMLGVDVHKVK